MSQSLLADLSGVRTTSVKRWENQSYEWQAPDDVWDILEQYESMQREIVDSALVILEEKSEEIGATPAAINLTYWQTEEQYEEAHPGEGRFWQMANANSRLIGFILAMEGFEISFQFEGMNSLDS